MPDRPTSGVHIDSALAARLVASQFSRWAHLPVTPVMPGGNDNRTFHLGDDLSVRLPSAAGYAAQVGKEHRWLPFFGSTLPLPIPEPLAMGFPGEGYPWNWSVYRWIDGNTAEASPVAGSTVFATALGGFLASLQQINPTGGPPPGDHNFFRGGPLTTYDAETRATIALLGSRVAGDLAADCWEAALHARWDHPPVWVHGDVAAGNLLVRKGRLRAVIDFGCSAVGDPACDLTVAWTLLSGSSRAAFRAELPLDAGTWARGRGWALWKALITLAQHPDDHSDGAARGRWTISEVLAEHRVGS